MANNFFTMELHHGGNFVWEPHVYIGAKIDYIKCDSDKMFMFEIMDIYCQEIGGDGS